MTLAAVLQQKGGKGPSGHFPTGVRQSQAEKMDVPGASSQALTGEIGLSEFHNVFAEVSICPETTKLHQKSLRETHFEAAVARFEFSWKFSRESK